MNRTTKRTPSEPPEFSAWFDGNRIAYAGRTRKQFLDAFAEGWRACLRAERGLPPRLNGDDTWEAAQTRSA